MGCPGSIDVENLFESFLKAATEQDPSRKVEFAARSNVVYGMLPSKEKNELLIKMIEFGTDLDGDFIRTELAARSDDPIIQNIFLEELVSKIEFAITHEPANGNNAGPAPKAPGV